MIKYTVDIRDAILLNNYLMYTLYSLRVIYTLTFPRLYLTMPLGNYACACLLFRAYTFGMNTSKIITKDERLTKNRYPYKQGDVNTESSQVNEIEIFKADLLRKIKSAFE